MSTFMLTIATPDGDRLHEAVEGLFLRGAEGDLAVLPGHMPFVTTIRKGTCRVEFEDGHQRSGHTEGGLLTVGEKQVTVLAGSFEWDE